MLSLDNKNLHITAVKRAEDSDAVVVRMFNPTEKEQTATLSLAKSGSKMWHCRADERVIEPIGQSFTVGAKKIFTVMIK